MNKNFLKKDNIIVASKKIFYLKLLIVFVVSIISSIAIYVYINSFVIMNLNDSYEANIKLKDKINSLKIEINRNQEYIKKLIKIRQSK